MARRALLIGIDDYPSAPLHGCINDAISLRDVISRHHDSTLNFQCDVLTSDVESITRARLREKMCALFDTPAEVAYLHFSGHGTVTGLGGYLITPDAVDYDVGVSMTEVIGLANASPVSEVIITLDCCHSGAMGIVPALTNDKAVLADGVSILTAARSDEASVEEGGGGLFSTLLIEALDGGAAGVLGDITAASVYTYIDNALGAWDQRPLFKSNVSRFVRLRNSAPKIALDTLHKVIHIFPLPAEDLHLDPEYEPRATPHDAGKEETFKHLLRLRHAGLVEPVDEEHMYDAAMNRKACRLTNLGRYYWRLVNDTKL